MHVDIPGAVLAMPDGCVVGVVEHGQVFWTLKQHVPLEHVFVETMQQDTALCFRCAVVWCGGWSAVL